MWLKRGLKLQNFPKTALSDFNLGQCFQGYSNYFKKMIVMKILEVRKVLLWAFARLPGLWYNLVHEKR